MNLKIAAPLLAGALLAGCGDPDSGVSDGPVGAYNDSPAYVLNEPDQFANIAIRCVGGNGIYVTTRDAPPVVVAQDPLCAEGGFFADLGFASNPDVLVRPKGGSK